MFLKFASSFLVSSWSFWTFANILTDSFKVCHFLIFTLTFWQVSLNPLFHQIKLSWIIGTDIRTWYVTKKIKVITKSKIIFPCENQTWYLKNNSTVNNLKIRNHWINAWKSILCFVNSFWKHHFDQAGLNLFLKSKIISSSTRIAITSIIPFVTSNQPQCEKLS